MSHSKESGIAVKKNAIAISKHCFVLLLLVKFLHNQSIVL